MRVVEKWGIDYYDRLGAEFRIVKSFEFLFYELILKNYIRNVNLKF